MRFLNPAHPKRLLPRLRRLFARRGFEREEVNILRGILARIDQLHNVAQWVVLRRCRTERDVR